jgi:hypothetical protein
MMNEEDEPRPSSRRPLGVDDYSAERIIRRSRDSQPTALNGKPIVAQAPASSLLEGGSASDGGIPVHIDSTPPAPASSTVSEEWTPSSSATTNAVGIGRTGNTPPLTVDNRGRFWAVVIGFSALTGLVMFMVGRML